jgi:hypothetical protein
MSLKIRKICEILNEHQPSESIDFCIAEIEIIYGKILTIQGVVKITKKIIKIKNKFRMEMRKSKGNFETMMKSHKKWSNEELKVPKSYFVSEKKENERKIGGVNMEE